MCTNKKLWWQSPVALCLLTIVTSLHYGFSYGTGNQTHYLLHAFSIIYRDFAVGDWFINSDSDYHTTFTVFVVGISSLTKYLAETLVFFQILVNLATFGAIYLICQAINRHFCGAIYIGVIAIVFCTNIASVGYSVLVAHPLQASSFATLSLLMSFYYFIRDRMLLGGLFLVLAGYFHVNFVILALPAYSLCLLFNYRSVEFSRVFFLLAPATIYLIGISPDLINVASGEYANEARRIFQTIRAPHHYQPMTFLHEFTYFVGWVALGVSCVCMSGNKSSEVKRATAIALSCLAVILLGTLFTTVVYIPAVSQIFVYRLAPFCTLVFQVLILSYFVGDTQRFLSKGVRVKAVCFVLIIAGAYSYSFEYGVVNTAMIFPVLIYVLSNGMASSTTKRLLSCLICLMLAVLMLIQVIQFIVRTPSLNGFNESDGNAVFEWAATTPLESSFIVPPSILSFKFHSGRSTVVDWKSIPVDPRGVIEWYSRVRSTSNGCVIGSRGDAVKCYNNMTWEYVNTLHKSYGADYIVITKSKFRAELPAPNRVYENSTFAIYRIYSEKTSDI